MREGVHRQVFGKLARRPGLDKALLIAREGDQLVVSKLDRLGRSLEHLIELSKELQSRGVDLVVLDQGIDTSTPVGRMFFQILGAIAEFEVDLLRRRTCEGTSIAKRKGKLRLVFNSGRIFPEPREVPEFVRTEGFSW